MNFECAYLFFIFYKIEKVYRIDKNKRILLYYLYYLQNFSPRIEKEEYNSSIQESAALSVLKVDAF